MFLVVSSRGCGYVDEADTRALVTAICRGYVLISCSIYGFSIQINQEESLDNLGITLIDKFKKFCQIG
jgi:hypothetical protein